MHEASKNLPANFNRHGNGVALIDSNTLESLPWHSSTSRRERIVQELRMAIGATSGRDMGAWSLRCGRFLVGSGVRRMGRLWSLLSATGDAAAIEWQYLKGSKSVPAYARDRSRLGATQWQAARQKAITVWRQLSAYSRANPTEAATRLTLLCLGFQVGSGGLDGDGGIPDTDWDVFDTHRSIFTHSIIAGMAVEVLVAALVDLVSTIHEKLPADHDPIWDSIKAGSSNLELFALGASAGIAYHLGIDATVDGDGHYADLPFSATQVGHQAIAAANAVVEGLDAVARLSMYGDTVATYGNLKDARDAVTATDTPTSFVVQRLRHNSGFRVTWRPRQTPKPV